MAQQQAVAHLTQHKGGGSNQSFVLCIVALQLWQMVQADNADTNGTGCA